MSDEDKRDDKCSNQWTGRTTRMIALYSAAAIMILCLGAGFLYLLYSLYKAEENPLSPIVILVAAIVVIIALASVINTSVGLFLGEASIFHGSGRPVEMTQHLYQSFFLQSQVLLALLLVGVISVFLAMKVLTASEALPIITGATGFALGRDFDKKRTLEKNNQNSEL